MEPDFHGRNRHNWRSAWFSIEGALHRVPGAARGTFRGLFSLSWVGFYGICVGPIAQCAPTLRLEPIHWKMLKKIIHSTDSPAAVEAGMEACGARIRMVIRVMRGLVILLVAGLIIRAVNPGLVGPWGDGLLAGVVTAILVQGVELVHQKRRLTKLQQILNSQKHGSMRLEQKK